MLRSFGHLWRLWCVGRCFARHGVLSGLQEVYKLPKRILPLFWLLQFGATVSANTREQRLGKRLAAALEELGPAFIKLGQSMATRPDAVGTQMAADLLSLQDAVAPFSGLEAIEIIEAELGLALTDAYTHFDETPIAAASIAQVHRATNLAGERVAVKVLRPGIAALFAADLATFAWAAQLIETGIPAARRLRPSAVVETLARSVADELDLRIEAAHASELADISARIPAYRVPRVDWARSGRSVLTLEWIDGTKPVSASALEAKGIDPIDVSTRLVQVFLTQAMHAGFFHADCHQGNLLIEDSGTIAALDFGIMGRLDAASRRTLALILNGFLNRDYKRIAELHFEAGYVDEGQSVDEFASALRAIGEPITGKPLKGISVARLLTQLLATTERYSMRTQPQLLMLQKTMVMVEGLAYSLNSDLNMWETARPVLERWAKENLSPEVQAADALLSVYGDMKALPRRLDKIIDALEGQAPLKAPESKAGRKAALWFGLGALAALVFLT